MFKASFKDANGYSFDHKITVCYKCKDRILLCHDTCPDYLEQRKKIDLDNKVRLEKSYYSNISKKSSKSHY